MFYMLANMSVIAMGEKKLSNVRLVRFSFATAT
jgi:hypothetical protein